MRAKKINFRSITNCSWWVTLLMIFLVLSCKPPVHGSDPVVGYKSEQQMANPGYAMKVISHDMPVFESYVGVEDVNSKRPISENSLFNVGSITKTFVAFAILNLADEGKLKLSDSLIKFFPDFKNKEIGKHVRIYHLLTHSSGLPDNRHPYQDSIYYLTADDAQNWAPILQNDTLLFPPGSRFEYSNPAFNALALMVQQITGVKWQDYVKNNIFDKANMAKSTITDGSHPDSSVCHAYVYEGSKWKELDYGEEPTFNASGNGGVWSSVNELYLYEKAILSHSFTNEKVNALARNIYPLKEWKDTIPSVLGLSWFISSFQGHTMYSHTGSQGGFTADYVSIPEQGFFYCILSNTPLKILETRAQVLKMGIEKGWIK